MKQEETLEEAIKRLFRYYPESSGYIKAAIIGKEWQQERMYSEEDMMFAYEQGARLALISQSPLALHKGEFPTPKEWFEEFKNK